MQYVGFFLVVVSLAALIAGVLNQLKAKKILAAPFKKTGEIARNPAVADAKGTISTEGAIAVGQPLVAPCSGKPCVYYEIELVRHWEKTVTTENGPKTEKGTTSISTTKVGSQFQLDDGSGPVGVDARESVDCELDKSFEQMQNVGWGDVVFGQHRTHVPHHSGDEHTVGVKCVEKIVPAQGSLFVLGKLAAGVITRTEGMLGKLMASTKGREKLLGATKRNAVIGFVAAGVSVAAGIPMAIFGDPPHDSCANMKDAWAEVCSSKIYDASGANFDWTITKAGNYSVEVTQPNVKVPIFPVLTVTDGTGSVVGKVADTQSVVLKGFLKPGTYKINVKEKSSLQVKGGYSFSLKFAGGPAEAPASEGSAAPSAVASATAAPKPAPVGPAHAPGHAPGHASAAATTKATTAPVAKAAPKGGKKK